MKLSRVASSSPIEASRKLGVLVVVACFLLPCLLLSILNSNLYALPLGNIQLSVGTNVQLEHIQDDTGSTLSGTEMRVIPVIFKEELVINQPGNPENSSTEDTTLLTVKEVNVTILDIQVRSSEIQSDKDNNITNSDDNQKQSTSNLDGKLREENSNKGNLVVQSNIWCDFTHERFDTCTMNGDVRVLSHSSTFILASPSQSNDSTFKIRPYARKWESPVMETINELTLKSSSNPEEIPSCTVNHNVPAIIFSTGGFIGNFFHDFTDVIVPLFTTSRQYVGQVQFLITDYKPEWVKKYRPILRQLTRYEIINMDSQDDSVHCFPQAQVGLMSHKAMGVDPTNTPNGYTMEGFRDMLRTSFSLKRKSIKMGTRKPRLLILQRKGSRSLVNKKEVVDLGRRLGFKVAVAGPEEVKNLSRFARSVNAADVMMGVHGAGLTNMVFLPTSASLIQIVPWGGLKWACRHAFGEPAPDMGVRYLEYEIKEEESTLIQQYPRDDPVFTDPESVQKQGWNMLWSVFLQKQNVMLDIRRFKPTLLEALKSLHR